jgi:uncharacterized integral membrane protein
VCVTAAGAIGIVSTAASCGGGKMVISIYLVLQVVLFAVKLLLFAFRNIATVSFRFRLLLSADGAVFSFELIVVPT